MTSCWFIVIRCLDAWWVDCEGKGYGPFDDLEVAKAEAIELVRVFGDTERHNVVYAPSDDGKLHIVWSSIPSPVANESQLPSSLEPNGLREISRWRVGGGKDSTHA
jgi:hypothetical protein